MDNEALRGSGYAGVPCGTSKWTGPKGNEVRRKIRLDPSRTTDSREMVPKAQRVRPLPLNPKQ